MFPFHTKYCSKNTICVIVENNRNSMLFPKHLKLIMDKGFLTDKETGTNINLSCILKDVGIDYLLLPSFILELNLIELVFNITAQNFI